MQLLRLLADGNIHSGVELASQLSISRMTVSNRVAEWVSCGVAIDVLPGRGYRLERSIQFLDQDKVMERVGNISKDKMPFLCIEESIGSTNDMAAQLMSMHGSRIVCLAEYQQQGRGRRGREWYTTPGGGFYGSFAWRIPAGFHALEGLSLAVGVELVEVLERFGINGVGLKWPNDLVTEHGKLGGVLIEVNGEVEGPCDAVVGIGLNIDLPVHVKLKAQQPVVDLVSLTRELPDRNHLTAEIIIAITLLLDSFTSKGFGYWRERWLKRDAFAGKEIILTGGHEPLNGVGAGVNEQGALLVKTPTGLSVCYGGELTLRQAELQ
jgi:BirA family biotin operon repressor/biotin-[acetyl-CoA-carboxylase] ligase